MATKQTAKLPTKARLVAAAKDLNKSMGLDQVLDDDGNVIEGETNPDEIPTSGTAKDIVAGIKKASKLVADEDTFKADTEAVLVELGIFEAEEKKPAPKPKPKSKPQSKSSKSKGKGSKSTGPGRGSIAAAAREAIADGTTEVEDMVKILTPLYKSKGVTDKDFIEKRAKIYLRTAA